MYTVRPTLGIFTRANLRLCRLLKLLLLRLNDLRVVVIRFRSHRTHRHWPKIVHERKKENQMELKNKLNEQKAKKDRNAK